MKEILPPSVLEKMQAPPKSDDPIIDPHNLPEADAFIFGFPTRLVQHLTFCRPNAPHAYMRPAASTWFCCRRSAAHGSYLCPVPVI